MQTGKEATRELARRYAEKGNPNGWFEAFYARAEGDIHQVYWADLAPNPRLVSWLKEHPPAGAPRAGVIGCGLGDDAELLAAHGYRVTAFDISPAAIAMCNKRFPASRVTYTVGDLFAPEAYWRRGFDLVYECNTVQILSGAMRERAVPAIAELVAPEGVLLVSCRSREPGQDEDAFPVPLDRDELDGFTRAGLAEVAFTAYDDDQSPPVPHVFAVYARQPA